MSSTVSCSSAAARRGAAHAEFSQDGGYGDRVGDVGITALAFLALVALLCHREGPLDQVEVLFGVVRPDCPQQRFKDGRIRAVPRPVSRASRDRVRSRRPGKGGARTRNYRPEPPAVRPSGRCRNRPRTLCPDLHHRPPLAPTSNVLPQKYPSHPFNSPSLFPQAECFCNRAAHDERAGRSHKSRRPAASVRTPALRPGQSPGQTAASTAASPRRWATFLACLTRSGSPWRSQAYSGRRDEDGGRRTDQDADEQTPAKGPAACRHPGARRR